jgi:hypothetical protein
MGFEIRWRALKALVWLMHRHHTRIVVQVPLKRVAIGRRVFFDIPRPASEACFVLRVAFLRSMGLLYLFHWVEPRVFFPRRRRGLVGIVDIESLL